MGPSSPVSMIGRWMIALVLMGETARADDDAHWLTYAAIRNDVFTDLQPPIDDAGFTHDTVVSLRREHAGLTFGGSILDRWITSREDQRRWDQLELLALGEYAWPHRISTVARLGPTFGGNFGGRALQSGWHGLTGTGPTLDQGLQSDYPDHRRAGIVAGGGARADVGSELGGYGVVDGQLALGGGVTAFQIAVGGRAAWRHLVTHVELAVSRYHVADPNLGLPGGYGRGFQLEWRAGIDVRWSRFQLGYEYRANEGGSGEPIGVIAFQSRR